jgi:hypothetical protein
MQPAAANHDDPLDLAMRVTTTTDISPTPFSQSRTKPRHCPEWDIEYVFGRAVESVLSPLGWDGADIRRELAETQVPELTTFTNTAMG